MKSLQYTMYHSFLRVSAVVLAAVLVFDSGLLSTTTSRLSDATQLYVANAIGVTAGVPENDVNKLTARIAELEQAATDREISVDLNSNTRSSDTSTFILSGILFILIVLIVLNYALDYARARERNLLRA